MMTKKNCAWKNFFGRQKTQMKICLRTSLTWIQIICQTSFPKKIEYSIQRLVLGSDLLEVFFGFVIFFGWWRYNQVKHRILILTHHRSGSTFTGELFNLHSQKGFQIDAFSSMMSHQPSLKCLQCLFNINQFENLSQTFYMFEPLRYASGASDLHEIFFIQQTEMLKLIKI